MNRGDTWNTDGSMTKGNTPEVTVNKNASNKEEICFPTLTLHYLYFTPFYKKYMKYNQQPVRTQDCRILFFKYGQRTLYDRPLDYFQFLVIANKIAINIHSPVSFYLGIYQSSIQSGISRFMGRYVQFKTYFCEGVNKL